ncbi:MAG: ion transporter, partial [Lachnospiraceae bacterium]|nr:ion transporter [Lachnospiraceae bacterium]
SSLFIYSAEHTVQPDKFKNAFSGIWWSVSALLTVGYGDIYPITVVGQVFAIITAMLGVACVAIPTGIISAGFVEHYSKMKRNEIDEQTSFGIMNLHMIWINMDSSWIGLTAKEIADKYDATIVSVKRGDETMQPDEDFKVEQGDTLAVFKR